VDADDQAEARKTRVLLQGGPLRAFAALFAATARNLLTHPAKTIAAFRLALRISKGSDRGVIVHMAYAAEACLLRQRLAKTDVTHLHAHFATNSAAVAMLCHVAGGPVYSFTVHGQKGLDLPGPRSLREKVRRARFVVCVSDFGRACVMYRCDMRDWSKIHVVRCGLGRDLLDHVPTPVPPRSRIVCVGRLATEKAHVLLLEAAAALRDAGLAFDIVLVGDGELRADVERRAHELKLEERIQITGWATAQEVRAAIQGSRILVMQSLMEGLPVVIMEAFALGRPVVAPWLAGIPELVEPGRSGWLFTPASAPALAAALRQALETSPEELGRMAARGRSAVLDRHDVAKSAQALRCLFAATHTDVGRGTVTLAEARLTPAESEAVYPKLRMGQAAREPISQHPGVA
jgi:glycosyltransferase involved in cell wall biosynthesis